MSRPSFQEIYMQLAQTISKRSGLPNCCDREEAGNCGCLHSEENSIINCDSPRTVEKFVFVTHLPCVPCAKRLINLGNVKKVYYHTDYRLKDSIEMLKSVGIEIEQI
jgi:deoxycytidylate deaminase